MKKLLLGLSLLALSLASGAQTILRDNSYFKTTGAVSSFQWAPERYQNSFRYDIFYYIPEKLKDSANVGSLIFMHGGGGSTMTRAGSISTVNMYMGDLKKLADELGIVVVLPSANGLNWGGHTRGLLKELARLMRKDLKLDANRMGVSGHSMGGMGITRNYGWVADEFAFFIPQAAGMIAAGQYEYQLNKVFNIPYVHLQGLDDHFPEFVTNTRDQVSNTQKLELQYGVKSKLEAIFYQGGHNYDRALFTSTTKRLIETSPRNLYQKELWGSLHTVQSTLTENKISFDYNSEARYFWVELTGIDTSAPERTDFHAKIVDNEIHIDMPILPKQSKGMKVYLHPEMVNLDKRVKIYLNGAQVAKRRSFLKKNIIKNMDPNDPGFNFVDAVEFDF